MSEMEPKECKHDGGFHYEDPGPYSDDIVLKICNLCERDVPDEDLRAAAQIAILQQGRWPFDPPPQKEPVTNCNQLQRYKVVPHEEWSDSGSGRTWLDTRRVKDPDGDYVLHADCAKLEAELVDARRIAGDALDRAQRAIEERDRLKERLGDAGWQIDAARQRQEETERRGGANDSV
jgi:hypothetical protein